MTPCYKLAAIQYLTNNKLTCPINDFGKEREIDRIKQNTYVNKYDITTLNKEFQRRTGESKI